MDFLVCLLGSDPRVRTEKCQGVARQGLTEEERCWGTASGMGLGLGLGFFYGSSVTGGKGRAGPPAGFQEGRMESRASLRRRGEGAAAGADGARGAGGRLGAGAGAKARGAEESFSCGSDFGTPSGCFRSLRS